jgi:hypothetical protein
MIEVHSSAGVGWGWGMGGSCATHVTPPLLQSGPGIVLWIERQRFESLSRHLSASLEATV